MNTVFCVTKNFRIIKAISLKDLKKSMPTLKKDSPEKLCQQGLELLSFNNPNYVTAADYFMKAYLTGYLEKAVIFLDLCALLNKDMTEEDFFKKLVDLRKETIDKENEIDPQYVMILDFFGAQCFLHGIGIEKKFIACKKFIKKLTNIPDFEKEVIAACFTKYSLSKSKED